MVAAELGSISFPGNFRSHSRSRPGCYPDHLEGILNYCRTLLAMGVVEAISGNISLLRGYGGACRNQVILATQDTAESSAKTP